MALLDSANSYSFAVHAYCFMPDHLHLLTSGQERQSLVRFIQHFKQRSSFAYKREAGRLLWQTSFWDHILRESEDMVDVARYIWANPVRAGLAEDLRAYPFSGPSPLPAVAWQS
jgi:putative transposase